PARPGRPAGPAARRAHRLGAGAPPPVELGLIDRSPSAALYRSMSPRSAPVRNRAVRRSVETSWAARPPHRRPPRRLEAVFAPDTRVRHLGAAAAAPAREGRGGAHGPERPCPREHRPTGVECPEAARGPAARTRHARGHAGRAARGGPGAERAGGRRRRGGLLRAGEVSGRGFVFHVLDHGPAVEPGIGDPYPG